MSSIVLLHLNHSSLKNGTCAGQTRKKSTRSFFSSSSEFTLLLKIILDTIYPCLMTQHFISLDKKETRWQTTPESRAWGSDKLLATFVAQSKP